MSFAPPLLQNMVHLVYANIDWKAGRHETSKAEKRNLTTLENTLSSIMQNMHPAVLCLCEVGTATQPLNAQMMTRLTEIVVKAWSAAATEHGSANIQCHYELGSPYLTAWDANHCDCRHFRIMQQIFQHKDPRTAQLFLCCLPNADDGDGIDVINVHAPSGQTTLTEKQRTDMLRNLLQSTSKANKSRTIGGHRGIIGGDMNTTPHTFHNITARLRRDRILTSTCIFHYPLWAKHGDACMDVGSIATLLPLRTQNHDPQHEIYGVSLLTQLAHATEQRSSASIAPTADASACYSDSETTSNAASFAWEGPTADATVAPQATVSTIAERPESAAEKLVPVAVATSSVSIAPSAPATAAPPATKTIKTELAPATEHRRCSLLNDEDGLYLIYALR